MSAWDSASWSTAAAGGAEGDGGHAGGGRSLSSSKGGGRKAAARPWKSVEPLVIDGAKAIEKISGADPKYVLEHYLGSGEGTPVVFTDAQKDWFGKGARRWTLDWIAERYGAEELAINDRAPLQEWDDPPMRTRFVSIAEYAAYARGEETSFSREPAENPWYMNSWEPFGKFPELLAEWDYPYFCEDLLKHDDSFSPTNVVNYSKVFCGVPGATTRLHYDNQQTHAWLAQVDGRKQFVLYAPSDAEHLRLHAWEEKIGQSGSDGLRRAFDPSKPPDPVIYPQTRKARAYVAVVEPGETILVPRGWWHYARALDVNVTLMRNFVNSANSDFFQDSLKREPGNLHKPRILDLAKQCVVCKMTAGKKGVLPCGSCKAVAYCGRDCQKKHWASHKRFCGVLKDLCLPCHPASAHQGDARKAGARPPAEPQQPDLFAAKAPGAGDAAGPRAFAKKITREGRGPTPDDEAMVRVHYDGYLADGQKMDSSTDKDKAFDFHITRSGVARGWREATRTMRVGEKATVAVAPHAAYAERGVPDKVPPNSALVFDVEILEVW